MKNNFFQLNSKLVTFLFSIFILFISSCEESDAPSKIQNPDLKLKIKKKIKKVVLKKDWDFIKRNFHQFSRNNRWGVNFETDDHKFKGFKVYEVGKNGILSSLGISSGDIIMQVNGYSLNDTRNALKIQSTKIIPWVVDVLRKDEYYRYEFYQIENKKDYKAKDILNFELEILSFEVYKSKIVEETKQKEEEVKEFEENIKDKIAPVNPQTNKPYSVEEMKQFSDFIKEMPDNILLPKYLSQEENLEKQKFEERIKEITDKIKIKTASLEEAEIYFNHSELKIKSKIQITKYLLKQCIEFHIDSNTLKNFEDMIFKSNQNLKELKKQKKEYLKFLKNK
ncbi:MAG: hypothetical protein SFU98_20430 [Leptospiraceae bacterium]|nr:hypothetical protein [Leptospiraceae bacterium]